MTAGALDLAPDLLQPGASLLARVQAPGFGRSFVRLRDAVTASIALAPPEPFAVRLLEPDGSPAADAEVELVGGEARGVVLDTVEPDADGWVRSRVISAFHRSVHVRAYLPGHEVLSRDLMLVEHEKPIRFERTLPVRGTVVAPPDFPGGAAGLRVQGFNVFGPAAQVGMGGGFLLDYQPPPPIPVRLVLVDLPTGWTHRGTRVGDSRRVQMRIERAVEIAGLVVDRQGRAVAGAGVQHEHGPRGRESVACDASGRFVLRRVPPGSVRLRASFVRFGKRRRGGGVYSGFEDLVDLQPGERRVGVRIMIR